MAGARYAPTFSPRMRGEKVNQRQRAAMSTRLLEGVNLPAACVDGGRLAGVNLKQVNLEGAHLNGAHLHGTNPTDADLTICRIYRISAGDLK